MSRCFRAEVCRVRRSGLLHQNRTGVEQVGAATLDLLTLGPRPRGDDGDIATGGDGIREPGGEQSALGTPRGARKPVAAALRSRTAPRGLIVFGCSVIRTFRM